MRWLGGGDQGPISEGGLTGSAPWPQRHGHRLITEMSFDPGEEEEEAYGRGRGGSRHRNPTPAPPPPLPPPGWQEWVCSISFIFPQLLLRPRWGARRSVQPWPGA